MEASDEASSLPPSTVAPDDGPTLQELVARECAVLEAIAGVTSVKSYERQRREPLNKSMLKVRLRGRKDPLSVHCKLGVPNLLAAARLMMEKLADLLGEEAVAEGRRRADAARAAAAAPDAARASEETQPAGAGASLNFFEHSKLIRQLEAQMAAAQERARAADADLRSALLLVAAEQKAVTRAEERLSSRLSKAQAGANAAAEPLLKAKADVAEICASLAELRAKRQRLGEQPSADAAAEEAAETEAAASDAPPPPYLEYDLETFRRHETDEQRRRSMKPQRGVHSSAPRMGKIGALEHWRRGLIGAVQSWAHGSIDNVILLIMHLINYFDVSVEIFGKLESSGVRRPVCRHPPCHCPRFGC